MPWYAYVAHFFAGAILANGVPHFVNGISGRKFQTPFAKPPGIGESSPTVNVVWAAANFVVGFALLSYFYYGGMRSVADLAIIGFGAFVCAIMLAHHFGKVRGNL